MTEMKDLSTDSYIPDWCPGCGNFGILTALKKAITEQNINPKDIVIVSGIGCSSKLPQWINTFGFHSIHGRGLPTGCGIKIANKKLHVIVIGGDGDIFGEGAHHFLHTIRKNINITLLVHNNNLYALTKGQSSPTTPKGQKTSSAPEGCIDEPINGLGLAIAQKGSFVARGFAGDIEQLKELIIQGMKHKGFSYIDIIQQCITFNKEHNIEWFKKRIYKLEEAKYKPTEQIKALKKTIPEKDKIPTGIFYKNEKHKPWEELHPTTKKKEALTEQEIEANIEDLINELQ